MRNFNYLDSALFKAFLIAAQTLNFTEAAKKCGMTQSGMSQHMAKLEDQLGDQLFLRVGKKLILTKTGQKLQSFAEKYLDESQKLLSEISEEVSSLKGPVSYAMPGSCLMTPHFEILLERRKRDFPEVDLGVSITSSEGVIKALIENSIDFGFVTKQTDNPLVEFMPFCEEEFVLVGNDKKLRDGLNLENLKKQKVIDYSGAEDLFLYWKEKHFPKSKGLTWAALSKAGKIDDLKGVISMARAGVGLCILPRHCVERELKEKALTVFNEKKKIKNQIYIVKLKGVRLPDRVETVISEFFSMKN